jgi:hypothetical protein
MVFALLMPSTVFAADKKLLNEASITLSSDVIPVGGTTKIKVRLLAEMTSLTYAKLTPEVSDESILTVLSKVAYEQKMKTPQEVLDFTTYSNQIAAFTAANKKMDEGVKYEGQFVDGIDKYRKKYGI